MRMVVLHLLISAPGSLSVQGSHLLECMMTMMRSVIGWRVKRVKIANMFFSDFFWLEGLGIYWRYRNRYRAFWVPEKSIGIGIGKIWYRKKVSVSVSSKFGTGKKYRYRYRQNLVPEKSIGIGIEDIWYRKKVSVSVSLKIMGTVTLCFKGGTASCLILLHKWVDSEIHVRLQSSFNHRILVSFW